MNIIGFWLLHHSPLYRFLLLLITHNIQENILMLIVLKAKIMLAKIITKDEGENIMAIGHNHNYFQHRTTFHQYSRGFMALATFILFSLLNILLLLMLRGLFNLFLCCLHQLIHMCVNATSNLITRQGTIL